MSSGIAEQDGTSSPGWNWSDPGPWWAANLRCGATVTPTGIAIIGTGYWGPGIVRNLDRLDAAEVQVETTELAPDEVRRYLSSHRVLHIVHERFLVVILTMIGDIDLP